MGRVLTRARWSATGTRSLRRGACTGCTGGSWRQSAVSQSIIINPTISRHPPSRARVRHARKRQAGGNQTDGQAGRLRTYRTLSCASCTLWVARARVIWISRAGRQMAYGDDGKDHDGAADPDNRRGEESIDVTCADERAKGQ
jgi:hypothetical protein